MNKLMTWDGMYEGDALLAVDGGGKWVLAYDAKECIAKLEAKLDKQQRYDAGTQELIDGGIQRIAELEAELADRSWDTLMSLLDEHWSAKVFPTTYKVDEPERDVGPRIVSLLRWVDIQKKHIIDLETENESLKKLIHPLPSGSISRIVPRERDTS